MDFFSEWNHWSWWAIGIVLLVLEIFAPAAMFMWMGFAAIITGVILLIQPELMWQWQLLIFSLLSVITIILWKQLLGKRLTQSDEPLLNRRAEQYIGRTFTLDQPIVNGVGQVKVDDSSWRITGPDLPAGSQIRVVSENGMSLHVAAVESSDQA